MSEEKQDKYVAQKEQNGWKAVFFANGHLIVNSLTRLFSKVLFNKYPEMSPQTLLFYRAVCAFAVCIL